MDRRCESCGATTTDVGRAWCAGCGTFLPEASTALAPGAALASVPPPPRDLPASVVWEIRLTRNLSTMVGALLTFVFSWTFFLPLIGIPLLIAGIKKSERALRVLRGGRSAAGTLLECEQDTSQTLNNRHPWKIRYVYETPGGVRESEALLWDPAATRLKPGDPVQVVYLPGREEVSALWPPMT